MTDNKIIKAFDILDKFEFFEGQRAGRELWFNKPTDIQDKDIVAFLRDLDFLKDFIKSQQVENEKLKSELKRVHEKIGRLNEKAHTHHCRWLGNCYDIEAIEVKDIDNLLEEWRKKI